MIKITEPIEVALYTSKDLKDPETIRLVVHLFQSLCEESKPERFSINDIRKKLSEDDSKLMEEERSTEKYPQKLIQFIMEAEDGEKIHFSLEPCKYHQASIDIYRRKEEGVHSLEGRFIPSESLDEEDYKEEDFLEEDKEILSYAFIEWGKVLYNLSNPYYGYIKPGIEFVSNESQIKKDAIKRKKIIIPMIYWLNFLGPDFVNLIGREKILKAPFWKIEEFKDGGMLLVSTPKIFDTLLEEEKEKRRETYEFLGLEGIELDMERVAKRIQFH